MFNDHILLINLQIKRYNDHEKYYYHNEFRKVTSITRFFIGKLGFHTYIHEKFRKNR